MEKIGIETICDNNGFIIGIRDYQKGLDEAEKKTDKFSKSVGTSTKSVGTGFDVSGNKTSLFSTALGGLGTVAKGALTIGLGAATAAAGAFTAGLGVAIKEGMEAQEIQAQLAAVLESTGGAAGVTADMVNDLASEMQGVTRYTDDAVVAAENVLLTFTQVGKEVFPDTTKAILDMATALGTDLQSSTIMVGKALNDPIKGISALRRVGVAFTQEQEEMIKSLMGVDEGLQDMADAAMKAEDALPKLQRDLEQATVKLQEMEAAGKSSESQLMAQRNKITSLQEKIGSAEETIGIYNKAQEEWAKKAEGTEGLMEAQKMILAELQKEFGGSAVAAGQTFAGQLDILKNAMADLAEEAGTALLPILTEGLRAVTPIITDIVKAFANFVQSDKFKNWLSGVVDFIRTSLVPAFQNIFQWLSTNLPPIIASLADLWTNTLAPAFSEFVTWASENLPPLIAAIVDFISNALIPAVIEVAKWLGENLPPIIATLSEFVMTQLVPAITTVVEWLAVNLPPAIAAVSEFISTKLIPAIKAIAEWLGDVLPPIFKFIFGLIKTGIEVVQAIRKAWESDFGGIRTFVTGVFDAIKIMFSGAWENIKLIFRLFKDVFTGDWYDFGKTLRDIIDNTLNTLKDLFSNAWETIKNTLINLWDHVKQSWRDINWGNVGRNIVEGIANGITSAIDWAIAAIMGLGQAVIDAIKGFLGIASESKVMASQVGVNIPAGIGAGMQDGMRDLLRDVDSMMSDVVSRASVELNPSFAGAGVANAMSYAAQPAYSYSTHTSATNININLSGVVINNGMDLAALEAWLNQSLTRQLSTGG